MSTVFLFNLKRIFDTFSILIQAEKIKLEISYIAFYQNILYNAIMEIDKGSCKTYEKENYCALAGGFDDFFALCLRQKGCG